MEYEPTNSDDNNASEKSGEPTIRRSKGMILGLLKNVEPTDLRVATEDIEIARDCVATKSPLACVHLDTGKDVFVLVGRDGVPIERPTLQEVRLSPQTIECPINYLVAHGRDTGFHHFDPAAMLEFILRLVPLSATPESVFVLKLAACETGRGFATALIRLARARRLRLVLLASPLFLYSIPVLDDAELGTQKNDVDSECRKINYQNTITTREQYEQCICFGVLEAYRELRRTLAELLPSLTGKPQAACQALLDELDRHAGVTDPSQLKIPSDTKVAGPVDALNGRCTSLISTLRAEIIAQVNGAFATKAETQKLPALPSLVHLEQVILGWFSQDKLFVPGETPTGLVSVTPTMKRIAALVAAREAEAKLIREDKRTHGKDSTLKRADKLPITDEGSEFPLWNLYARLMRAIDEAARTAQGVFLRQLRKLLLSGVQARTLVDILAHALDPGVANDRSTLLTTSDFTQGVEEVVGATKGGFLIFCADQQPDPLLALLLRRLSTYRKSE